MNLIDAVVTEVVAEPYESWGKWWVLVKYTSWGYESQTSIMCKTEEEARKVVVGYKFQA